MTPIGFKLIEIEREALALKNTGAWHDALAKFEQILKIQPDWEHGYGWFNLAECYEEVGRFKDAGNAYLQAIQASPSDPALIEARASFLNIHGEPLQAIDEYITLLALDESRKNLVSINKNMIALSSLAERLGWSDEHLADYIKTKKQSVIR